MQESHNTLYSHSKGALKTVTIIQQLKNLLLTHSPFTHLIHYTPENSAEVDSILYMYFCW